MHFIEAEATLREWVLLVDALTIGGIINTGMYTRNKFGFSFECEKPKELEIH